jgi:hypothetical protein
VLLGTRGVLRIPSDGGAYCVCVADQYEPCRSDTQGPLPGESLADEILRRGGLVRRVRDVLDQLHREPPHDGTVD